MISNEAVERQLRMLALAVAGNQERLNNISREIRDWEFDGDVSLPVRTDNTRGPAGKAGRVIFNTDDGFINADDGSDWASWSAALAASIGAEEEMYALQYDDVGSGTAYLGEAAVGSDTSSAVWRIKKIVETAGDIVVTWADGDSDSNNIWDNRLGLSYS